MEPSVVTKVVTDELSITTRFINGLKELAMTRGIDFLEALIISSSATSSAATSAARSRIFWRRAMWIRQQRPLLKRSFSSSV